MARTSGDQAQRAEPSLVYVIGRVNQGVRRELRRLLRRYELSVPEFTTLSVLRRRSGLSNAQLSRRAMITPQSMIEVLGALEQRGLVRREVDPRHGRILRTELTRAGGELLDAAEPEVLAMQESMLVDVSLQHRQIVLNGLTAAMRRLSDGLERAAEGQAGARRSA